jgi:hypothetical protein
MDLNTIAIELRAIREKLGSIESLESKVDSLDARMRLGFEETHRLIKLGFESVEILDEKIDRRFNETERQHADHKTLIEAAIGSLGRDVRSPAGPASRRRR